MSAPSEVVTLHIERVESGYRALVVMRGAACMTGVWAELSELLEHVAASIADREAADEADPRAWVV